METYFHVVSEFNNCILHVLFCQPENHPQKVPVVSPNNSTLPADFENARRVYQTPQLSVFGHVRNLTASGSGAGGEGQGKNISTVKRP